MSQISFGTQQFCIFRPQTFIQGTCFGRDSKYIFYSEKFGI